MLSTLYGKLVAILVTFGALMAGMTIFVVRMSQEASTMEMDQRLNRPLAERLAQDIAPGAADHQTLQAARARLGNTQPGAEIHVLDAQGNVVASSLPPEKLKDRQVAIEPLKRCLYEPDSLPVLGDNPGDPGGRTIFSVARRNSTFWRRKNRSSSSPTFPPIRQRCVLMSA